MAWIQTVPEIEIEEERQVVEVLGEKVLLFRHEEQIYAVQAKCPHLNLPLNKGKICDGAIVCPFHKSAFDLATGQVKSWSPWPPGLGKLLGYVKKEQQLKVYPTKVEQGEIFVEVPDRGTDYSSD